MFEDAMIYQGVVKWFNDQKGFGFIKCPDLKEDTFVHYSAIITDDARSTLQTDDAVNFKVNAEKKGPSAFDVTVIHCPPP